MAWDATQPADNTKIRNLGTVIRANNEAIGTGDTTFTPESVNYANRTPLGSTNNPSALSDSYRVYCKEDANSNAELFGIDDAGKISQLTSRRSSVASTGYSMIAPGLMMQWSSESISGATGTATVTFPVAFSSTVFNAQATFGTNVTTGTITAKTFTATTMELRVSTPSNSSAKTVYWTAIGPA